ncbi:MAG: flippase-like domain-containing protein [Planctomycetes bacterium]|nr:flippase-like domain-containing protein [Planctomycetota bacterium]
MPDIAGSKKNLFSGHISTLLRFAVAAIALYFAFRGQSLTDIGRVFLSLDLWAFAAAVALYFLSQFVFVLRWLLLLITQKIYINYFQALRLHFLGLFYNNCLPGSVGGDLLRAWYVTNHTEKKVEAALSVFVDRAIGLASTIAIALLAYLFVPIGAGGSKAEITVNFNPFDKLIQYRRIILYAVAVVIIVFAGLCLLKKTRRLLAKILRLIEVHALAVLSKIGVAIRIYCSRPFTLLTAVFLSFLCQAMAITSFWIIGHNLGIAAPIKYYFVFFPMSWILGILPISLGGAGIVELGLREMFSQVTAVTQKQGLILGLAQRVIWLITSIPGLIIHLTGKHLPAPPPHKKN